MQTAIANLQKPILLNTYRKEIWDHYNFTIIELFAFDRFFNWALKGSMTMIENEGNKYFLMDYNYIAPSWGMSVIYLKKIMLHLSGSLPKNISTNLKYPLVRYTKMDTYKKWHSYYGFDNGTMNTLIAWENLSETRNKYLKGSKMLNIIGETYSTNHAKTQQKRKYSLDVFNIFIELLGTTCNDDKIFTQHKIPSTNNYTEVFANFHSALYSIYYGKFFTDYPLSALNATFLNQYKYYLNAEKIKEKLAACAGSWGKVKEFVLNCAETYSNWFAIDSEITNKKYLATSVSAWIYDRYGMKSWFYVSMLEAPTTKREANAEKLYNSFTTKTRNTMLSLYNKNWDGYSYWYKVKNLVEWYETYAEKLCEKDSNCMYWLGGGLNKFLIGYKEWLLLFTNNKPCATNIGKDCNTWSTYIACKKKEHNIEIDIIDAYTTRYKRKVV